jgi:hypothetical protein
MKSEREVIETATTNILKLAVAIREEQGFEQLVEELGHVLKPSVDDAILR